MMKRAPAVRREDGFTLVELLVSLALLVIMLALISGAMRFGGRAWEVSDQVDRGQTVATFRALLGQRLIESLPLMSSDERGVLQLAFHGASDELNFLSPLPSRDGLAAGLFSVTLRLAPARDGGRSLSLDFQPVGSANAPSIGDAHRPVRVAGVAQLAIRYYGSPKNIGEPRWLDEWLGQDALPRLVAVDVRFPAGDLRQWPLLTAELKLGLQLRPQR
jgi:prepilin-type N-terminal cleavage/methylation domain-containing protein